MDLIQAAELFAFGTLPVEDLPDAAMKSLESGLDTPSLFQLAISKGDDPARLRLLLDKAFEELGIAFPSGAKTGLSIARLIARDVLGGAIEPYEGARRIGTEVYRRFPELQELFSFLAYANEYEDDWNHQAEYAQAIVEYCRLLLGPD